jgi:tight adherence protein B
MAMWDDQSGQRLMLAAFALQITGCVVLWRMLRSI